MVLCVPFCFFCFLLYLLCYLFMFPNNLVLHLDILHFYCNMCNSSPKQRFLVLVCAVTMKYICTYIYFFFSTYIYININEKHWPPEARSKCQGAFFIIIIFKNLVYRYFTFSRSCTKPCSRKILLFVRSSLCDVVKTLKCHDGFLGFGVDSSNDKKIKQHSHQTFASSYLCQLMSGRLHMHA